MDPREWQAAVHESGHAIADHLQGLFPLEVTLGPTPGRGNVVSRDLHANSGNAARCVVSYLAGHFAECLLAVDNEESEAGASKDVAFAEKARNNFATAISLDVHRSEVKALLQGRANAIEAFARELVGCRRLVGDELWLALDRALETPGADAKLAAFRALRPGPTLARLQEPSWTLPVALVRAEFGVRGAGGLFDTLESGGDVIVGALSVDDQQRALNLVSSGAVMIATVCDPEESVTIRSIVQGMGLTLRLHPF